MIFGFTLQDKFGIFIAMLIVIVIASLSLFFYAQLESSLMNSLRTKLVTVAKIVAQQVDPRMIERVEQGNEQSEEYWKLKRYLKGVALTDNRIKSIYVMVKTEKEDLWKFIADEDFNKKQMAHLNEEYDVAPYPEMRLAFGGAIADKETNTDKWGRWLSGYAPIYNNKGHAVAIAGVDMAASEVDALRKQVRNVVLFSFVVGLILAIIFGRIGAVTITNPIMALVKGVGNIEQGKYGYKIDIRRKDEIGILVDGFNRMSDKLGEVDKLKSDFLSVISHELYTPITPIKDAAQMLCEQAGVTEDCKQLVGIIQRQIKKMQKLVDEMLDFSWLEIRDWKLNKEPVSLSLLGQQALDEMSEAAGKKGINLKLKLGEELPSVMIDHKRISHVLKIMLENAVKFTPEQGTVTLEIHKVSGGAEFTVSDTGIGISKADLEKIFAGFYQVEDHMTRTKGGVGLGLAIAKRIVEAHNGYLWAESAGLGEGSRFMFLIPIA